MKPQRKSKDEIQRIVRQASKDAISYIESDILPARLKSAKYFNGEDTLGHEEGRSKVVATKCRDAVRSVKPSLMRIFMATDKAVEFVPKGEEDVQVAEQQTKYAAYLFNKNGGFRLLNGVIEDALRKKAGFAKVYAAEKEESEIFDYSLGETEIGQLESDDIEILSHDYDLNTGIHSGQVQRTRKRTEIRMEEMPPEEFFIDPDARSIDDFYVCGQQREMRVSDLVEMGFDFDKVADLGTEEGSAEEEAEYRQGHYESEEAAGDPSMRRVLYTEAYMKMDIEGTGVAQLYAFLMAGSQYKLLDHYPVDDVPFAVFEIDPEPHTFFGRSLVELVENDQDAATSLLRGVLDNVALVNAPRTAYDDAKVNADDMMNGEVGGLVRTEGPPADKVFPLVVPDTSAGVLASVQYFDQVIDNKTGVTRASAGLDPDALQNATATAVDATTRAAMAQPETMARHLAEGGLTRLFRLVLRLVRDNPDQEGVMRLNGKFTPVEAGDFDPELDVTINVGLGTESEAVKIAALNQTFQQQMAIWQQYGPDNGLVTLTGMRNSLADALMLSGLHNVSRYYQPMSAEIEAQMAEEAAMEAQNAPPPPPDPYVQGKQIEAETKAQDNQMKAQAQVAEMQMKDDRERDQMLQDAILKAADLLGKHGIPVDLRQLYAMQAQN